MRKLTVLILLVCSIIAYAQNAPQVTSVPPSVSSLPTTGYCASGQAGQSVVYSGVIYFNGSTTGTCLWTAIGATASSYACTDTSADQAAIQGILSLGDANIGGSACDVTAPLVTKQGGNQKITVAKGTTLTQATNGNNNLLQSWGYANRGTLTAAPTYVSGFTGCTPGLQTITFSGGNATVQAIAQATFNATGPTTALILLNPGTLYSALPASATATTCTGTGTFTGGTLQGASIPVTITWSAGQTASVAWTTHGFTAGQFVLLGGSSPSNFNNVFQIASVTDMNDFVITLLRTPTTTPTGQAVGLAVDGPVDLSGGIWNYNGPNQNNPGFQSSFGMVLAFCQGWYIHDLTIENPVKFGLNLGVCRDAVERNITVNSPSDGIKNSGPLVNVVTDNLNGTVGDDGVSFETREAVAAPNVIFTFGDVINSGCTNIDLTQSGAGSGLCGFYGSSGEYMGGIYARNIAGTSTSAAAVFLSGVTNATSIDDFNCDNVNANAVPQLRVTSYQSAGTTLISTLKCKIVNNPKLFSSGELVLFDSISTINKWDLDINVNNVAWGGSGALYAIVANGPYNEGNITGTIAGGSSGRLLQLASTSTGTKTNIDKFVQHTGDALLLAASGDSTVNNFSITNSDIAVSSNVLNLSSSANVALFGNRFSGETGGIIRTTGNITVNGSLGGNTYLASAARQVTVSGTPTLNLKDNDPILGTLDLGTKPTITGCGTIATQTGGTTNGTFTVPVGTTSCAPVIPLPTAPTNWGCSATDTTTSTSLFLPSTVSATQCAFGTTTVVAGDIISWGTTPHN